ncbi:MAG: hypothetical protein RIT02_2493 [Planctomycetota bacterium]|jgi:cAMP phosphodiesterase
MRVELLPSSVGASGMLQFSQSVLINDYTAIDAGSVGCLVPLERQQLIRDVFLSHSHLDHIGSLPFFLDNVYRPVPECPRILASAATFASLRSDVFNDRIWPDFVRLSREETPFLRLQELRAEEPVNSCGLQVTPVSLDHPVPTLGFLVDDGSSTVAFITDTLPTRRVWELLAGCRNLRAVFLECSFPASLGWLAEKSGHLSSVTFAAELGQLRGDVPVLAWHLKPVFFDEIVSELRGLSRPGLTIAEPGRVYVF